MEHLAKNFVRKAISGAVCGSICLSVLFFASGCSTGEATRKAYTRTERARMLVEIANGALLEADPTGALQSLIRAEEEDPNLPELHHSKALALYAKKDLKRAISSAHRAVELKADYADANNTLGKLLIEEGKSEEAVSPLLLAAQDPLYRDAYKAWTNLGILNYKKGAYLQAEGFLDRAIENASAYACVAYYYRGHIRLKDHRLSEAIADYHQATQRVCVKFGEAYLALGMAYQEDRQFQLARKTFLEIQKRYPNTKLAEQAFERLRFLP